MSQLINVRVSLVLLVTSLVSGACARGTSQARANDEAAPNSAESSTTHPPEWYDAPTPTLEQQKAVIECVNAEGGYDLPPPGGEESPEMTEEQTRVFFDCVFKLNLETSFISQEGIDEWDALQADQERVEAERDCMINQGWTPDNQPGESMSFSTAPTDSGARQEFEQALQTCGLSQAEIDDGFGEGADA